MIFLYLLIALCVGFACGVWLVVLVAPRIYGKQIHLLTLHAATLIESAWKESQ
jgi:hypothetical protein